MNRVGQWRKLYREEDCNNYTVLLGRRNLMMPNRTRVGKRYSLNVD